MSHDGLERPEIVRRHARAIFWQRMGVALIGLSVMLIMVLLVLSVQASLHNQEIVIDCTTEGGECFERGQRATAEVIEMIQRDGLVREALTRQIVILAAYCAEQPGLDDAQEIRACVEENLGNRGRKQYRGGKG